MTKAIRPAGGASAGPGASAALTAAPAPAAGGVGRLGTGNASLGMPRYSWARPMNVCHIGPAPAELKALFAIAVLSALPIHASTTMPSGPAEKPSTTLSRKSSLVPVLEVAGQPKVSLLHWIACLDRMSGIM